MQTPSSQVSRRNRSTQRSQRTQGRDRTIYVYGDDSCPYCVKAKGMLQTARRRGWRTKYLNIHKDAAALTQHRAQLRRIKTIPAVFVGPTFLGGSDELGKFLKQDTSRYSKTNRSRKKNSSRKKIRRHKHLSKSSSNPTSRSRQSRSLIHPRYLIHPRSLVYASHSSMSPVRPLSLAKARTGTGTGTKTKAKRTGTGTGTRTGTKTKAKAGTGTETGAKAEHNAKATCVSLQHASLGPSLTAALSLLAKPHLHPRRFLTVAPLTPTAAKLHAAARHIRSNTNTSNKRKSQLH